jgi:uncharacterized membrane protein (UPF0127 family)
MHPSDVYNLSIKELFKLYFKNYGRITRKGFVDPGMHDSETSDCSFALVALSSRKTGVNSMERLRRQFLAAKIDAFGETLSAPQNKILLNGERFAVETVREPNEIWKELVRRPNLREGEGVLYLAQHLRLYILVMTGREYPIDVAWIKDGKVISVEEGLKPVSEERELDEESPIMNKRKTADKVLIVKSGTFKKEGITVGAFIQQPG